LAVSEDLLVYLSADTLAVGDPVWLNGGSLPGDFVATNLALGTKLNVFGPNGNIGVEFDGLSGGDAFQGPIAPAGVTGAGTRSIEVWAFNPAIAGEETLVSWGRRGGPAGTNLSFNYGSNSVFGAVGHWAAPDLGWGPFGAPAAGQWHHMVYTYDGVSARVYADGQLKNGRNLALNTHAGFTIDVGVQNQNPTPNLEPGLRYSGGIAVVRVHEGALSAADVLNNYNEERDLFGAPPVPPPGPAPTPALLPRGPKHRYEFSGSADDSVGGAHGTLVNPTGLATFHDGLVDLRQANNTANSNQATFTQGAYIDLPNGIISSLGTQATFEAWVNVETPKNWDRIFDFGRSDAGEDMATGAPNSEYIFATSQNGSNGVLRVAHRSENTPPPGFNENLIDDFSRMSPNVEHHLAVVWDEVAGTQSVYLDGQLLPAGVGPLRPSLTLAGLQDLNNWLGRAQWGDPLFDGAYNEFRIYDYPLSADEVLGNYQAGPDTVNVIPEPSAWVLGFLAVGLGAFAQRVRRRKLRFAA
jgi:hypothetical protein